MARTLFAAIGVKGAAPAGQTSGIPPCSIAVPAAILPPGSGGIARMPPGLGIASRASTGLGNPEVRRGDGSSLSGLVSMCQYPGGNYGRADMHCAHAP
jgi:hypothetical protein